MSALIEERAEDLYEGAPCGYLSTLADGTIVKVNRTFEKWTGHDRDDLLRKQRFDDLLTAGGRIYHETHCRPLLHMQGTVREIALEIECADGRRLPVLVNADLHAGDGGRPEIVRITVFDASDRRAYEQELVRARRRAEGLQRENARLYERERTVALGLQRAMLPQHLLEDDRCRIAAKYAAAVETLEVGGDWYDAFRVTADRIGLVVGDVVGKGLDAAATMGQLRSALRAHGVSGQYPHQILEHLDAFVGQTENAEAATVTLADIDLSTGEVHLASAGHPPPIVLAPTGDPMVIWDGRSPPLGIGSSARRTQTGRRLEPGSRILLYSDGAVERREGDIDAGIERLMSSFASRRDEPVEEVVAALSAEVIAEQPGADDICMLACVFEPPAG